MFPLDDCRIWIVAPNYSLAKEFDYFWKILVAERKKYGFGYALEKAQNNPDGGHMNITLNFGPSWDGVEKKTIIEVKSATNMQSIQADQADVVILSEAGDQEEVVWSKYVSTRYGRAIIPTTPKIAAEWLRKLIEDGRENKHMRCEDFEYNGKCSPIYDWERYWMEHWKAESRQSAPEYFRVDLGKIDINSPPSKANGHDCFEAETNCWAEKDPHYAEQFMGRWTQAAERVLPFRHYDPANGRQVSHVLDELPAWAAYAKHYVAVDYGFTDESAVGWFCVGPDATVILYDEIYEAGLTAFELVNMINERGRTRDIEYYIGDPKKPEVAAHFRRLGLPMLTSINKKRQCDRQAGHMTFIDHLSDDPLTGRPKFYVTRNCNHCIDEFRLLRRKQTSQNEWSDAAFEGRDHAYDMTRYFLTANPRGKQTKAVIDEDIQREMLAMKERVTLEYSQPRWAGVA